MDTSVLGPLWAIEQSILDIIDEICRREHIRYSLWYGTLLGAVRHQGFIPWDDDIDVMMPRKEYERFRKIWNAHPVDGFILQEYNSDLDYTNNFMKVRKDHTTFLHTKEETLKLYHKGVFVDIFPADRVAPSGIRRRIQYVASAVNLLYSRGFQSGTGGAIGVVEKLLLTVPRKTQLMIRKVCEQIIKHWNKYGKTEFYCACTIKCCKRYYPADTFDRLKQIEFNGKNYLSVYDTDTVLTIEYGDYMQLPPEKDRVWKHHPIILDLEHNYEELQSE